MKILEKIILKNGVSVQLEDWSEHNTAQFPNLYGFIIAAYPIAKRSSRYFIKQGEKFRLQIGYNEYRNYTNEMVLADFKALKTGKITLEDLADHFDYNEKDKWLLGMKSCYNPEMD